MTTKESGQDIVPVSKNSFSVLQIELTQIIPGEHNPRTSFDETELQELADSIEAQGLQQPIKVRPISDTQYEIVYGERRYKAHQLLGLASISAIVQELDDEQAYKATVTENLNRKDLSPLQEGRAYRKLKEEYGYDEKRISKEFGVSLPTVYSRIKLLNLIPAFAELLENKIIRKGVAEELSKYTNVTQEEVFEDHFAEDIPQYQSWRQDSRSEIAEQLEDGYSADLADYPILHEGCAGCPFNSGVGELFPDPSTLRCYNEECLNTKIVTVLYDKTRAFIADNPEMPVEKTYAASDDLIEKLEEDDIEMHDTNAHDITPEEPIKPVFKEGMSDEAYQNRLQKYEEKLAAYEQGKKEILMAEAKRKVYRRILITHKDVFIAYGHIEDHPNYMDFADVDDTSDDIDQDAYSGITPDSGSTPYAEEISAEQEQINICQEEIRISTGEIETAKRVCDNNIEMALRDLMKTECTFEGAVTQAEEKMFYVLLLGSMPGSVKIRYGMSDSYHTSDEDRRHAFENWSDDMPAKILRDYIVCKLSEYHHAFGQEIRNVFIQQHFPDKYISIVNKHMDDRDKTIMANETKITLANKMIDEYQRQISENAQANNDQSEEETDDCSKSEEVPAEEQASGDLAPPDPSQQNQSKKGGKSQKKKGGK